MITFRLSSYSFLCYYGYYYSLWENYVNLSGLFYFYFTINIDISTGENAWSGCGLHILDWMWTTHCGVDVDSINVYLEQSRTPLPLLTTETAWLGGRNIRIRGMDLKMHANLHYLYFYHAFTKRKLFLYFLTISKRNTFDDKGKLRRR